MNKKYYRLDRLLVNLGYGVRPEVRLFIKNGFVKYKDESIRDFTVKLNPKYITFNGKPLERYNGLYILMHKPSGYISSHDYENSIYHLLPPQWLDRRPKVNCVGRLDKDSSGLILLTDNGQFLHNIISPRKKIKKIYRITTKEPMSKEMIDRLSAGTIHLKGEKNPCLPVNVDSIDDLNVNVTLYEGKYHQLKRMFGSIGNKIVKLERIQIGEFLLDDLKSGEWRDLTDNEINKYI